MPGFLYFIPTPAKMLGPRAIADAGLGYAIDRKAIQPVVTGPTGDPGILVSDESAMDRAALKYRPTEQTWRMFTRDSGQVIGVGWYTDEPPTPQDLIRRQPLPGSPVTLPDGHGYQIPVARRFAEFEGRLLSCCGLPQSLARDGSGVWVPSAPIARYARLWDMLQGYLAAREEAMSQQTTDDVIYFTFPPINELAIGILGINYRIGADELEALGLWTQEARSQILRVALDEQTREDWIKKKAAAFILGTGDSSNGPEPSTPADAATTPPQSPSSTSGSAASTDDLADEPGHVTFTPH